MINLSSLFGDLSNVKEKGITFITSSEDEEYVSYKDIYDKSMAILGSLQQARIKHGSELIFQIEDNKSFIYLFWGCILGGIIPVPIEVDNNEENASKLFKIFNILDSPYVVTTKKVFNALEKLSKSSGDKELKKINERTVLFEDISNTNLNGKLHDSNIDDIALIQFSSGSTGNPKGVILTHENLLSNIAAINKRLNSSNTDSALSWMPLTHDLGLIMAHIANLEHGINQYFMPTSLFIRQPNLWMEKVSQHRVTQLYSPNFGYKHVVKYFKPEKDCKVDLSCIKSIANGAEPISLGVCNEFFDKMCRFGLNKTSMTPGYGLAEGTVCVSLSNVEDELDGYNLNREFLGQGQTVREVDQGDDKGVYFVGLGHQIDDCQIRISDDNNRKMEENVIGNVQIKGKNVTRGYFNNNNATASLISDDGWLRTGDLGFLRNGNLVITGRAKDIIFINGHNYYPLDIERVADKIEGIENGDIVVTSVFNKELQKDDIVVFVLFKKGLVDFVHIAMEIKKLINRLMGIDIKDVIPVKELPKTSSGKIQRFVLAEMYNNDSFLDVSDTLKQLIELHKLQKIMAKPNGGVQEKLTKILMDVLELETVRLNDNFFELGCNSTKLISLMSAIEKEYPNKIKITDAFSYPTIERLTALIESATSIETCSPIFSSIKLPKEYFYPNYESTERYVKQIDYNLQFVIKDDLFNKIQTASCKEGVDIHTILLSTFLMFLSQISGKKEISIQTMLNIHNMGRTFDMDLYGINDFSTLVKIVNDKLNDTNNCGYFDIHDIETMKDSERNNAILPFIYKKNLLSINVDMSDFFDVIMVIDSLDNSLICELKYNYIIFRKEKINELFNKYINITMYILDSY